MMEARRSKEAVGTPNAGGEPDWLLLAEDDLLFSGLFKRFFSKRYPQVKVRVTPSVESARELLEGASAPPALAVLDLNLEDGDSTVLCELLSCPFILWSANSGSDIRSKPKGRKELECVMLEFGTLGGFDLPPQ